MSPTPLVSRADNAASVLIPTYRPFGEMLVLNALLAGLAAMLRIVLV
jgi:hypothetical protein